MRRARLPFRLRLEGLPKDRLVCGLKLPVGLRDSSRLPEPLFTPATKAETGHDENISFEEACKITGAGHREEGARSEFEDLFLRRRIRLETRH
jgi:phosphoribosylaminoimidazole-succinocarboxamide synthase